MDDRTRLASLSAGARVFALVALAAPIAVIGDDRAILNAILISAGWMLATFTDGLRGVPAIPALSVEAGLVTALAALSLAESTVLLPALVVPAFIGGLLKGHRGIAAVLATEVGVLGMALSTGRLELTAAIVGASLTWLMVGLGFGVVGSFVARTTSAATTTSYRDARELITQLLKLSGQLTEGLDPVSISDNILTLVRADVPLVGSVVYAVNGSAFVPLLEGEPDATQRDHHETLCRMVLVSGRPAKAQRELGIPLRTDAGLVGVVVGTLAPWSNERSGSLEGDLLALTERLAPAALQLDTAMLFREVRDEATAEERQRLAREMHDGVAQDLASLGYLIDDLAVGSADHQADQVAELRRELSNVVSEFRESVFGLRSESRDSRSLGARIEALADHLGRRSGVQVTVDLDECSGRLRPAVEAEVLRIAQEGINNAIKHARTARIDVSCRVRTPGAELVVRDFGRGLQRGRDDSHGVRIMRERARRIGAELELHNAVQGPGTVLRLTLDPTTRLQTSATERTGQA
ncbi:sensor histidine kinase [Nocardioides donggukensis]|uniref:histidine kinase n=1 Tax=Nocardioides donggukensis TaxID=2774019 RepID=A0A927K3K1_9ACTN|nr:histidine kinase [Nocardioides donggukensis]MBD8869151.1 hypothetical protein [Nocardioides donggukensis]